MEKLCKQCTNGQYDEKGFPYLMGQNIVATMILILNVHASRHFCENVVLSRVA